MTRRLTDDIAYASITELGALLRSRQISPTELIDATLARVRERNPSITAFVYMNEEYARAQAKDIERRLLAGEDTGPLMGIPTAIKDLADSRPGGWISTLGGIRALKEHVIDAYCNFSESMERAGAIPLGKTNSPTFGFRGTCDNYLHGPTRNPFDVTKNSGGSSGGSAAAVADGLIPFGEGTDGGGSIRIPSSWCNLFGFKGSACRLARLSRPSGFSATSLFTFEGCLTRSVEDTAIVMEAMGGHDPRDPMSLADHVDWLGALKGSVKGWRVAYSPDFGVFPVDARVKALVREAAQAFEDAGAHVEEVPIHLDASVEALGDLWCRLQIPNSIVQIDRLQSRGIDLLGEHKEDLPPELRYWADVVTRQNVIGLSRDQELRTTVYDAVQGVFENHDLLLTPTLACPPVDNATDGNTMGPAEIDGVRLNRLIGWCLTFFLNFTGHPAASVRPASSRANGPPACRSSAASSPMRTSSVPAPCMSRCVHGVSTTPCLLPEPSSLATTPAMCARGPSWRRNRLVRSVMALQAVGDSLPLNYGGHVDTGSLQICPFALRPR